MSAERATVARSGSVERIGRDLLRFPFEVTWPDGRRARVQATALRAGHVVDLQAEGTAGFHAGTSGDSDVDAAICEHVAGFARGSTGRRPVVTRGRS